MLFTRSILQPPSWEDGLRISIMSRHTFSDGVTPDTRIQKYHLHLPLFAPSSVLIGSYYRRGLPWDEFATEYVRQMRTPRKAFWVRHLAGFALWFDVTLLCVEGTAEYCHRRLLAEECQKYQPALKVTHL